LLEFVEGGEFAGVEGFRNWGHHFAAEVNKGEK